jgi:hypothetical protein
MPPTIQGVVIGFIVLLAVFQALQLLRHYNRRLPLWRRGLGF